MRFKISCVFCFPDLDLDEKMKRVENLGFTLDNSH